MFSVERVFAQSLEMGHRCCSKQKIKRGLWSPEEDEKLLRYINTHGHKSWSSVPKYAGKNLLSSCLCCFCDDEQIKDDVVVLLIMCRIAEMWQELQVEMD